MKKGLVYGIWILAILAGVMCAGKEGGGMFCPVCQEKGLTSRVYPGMTLGTLMNTHSYYDENGVYHHEDPNSYTTEYSCSQGHAWRIVRWQDGEEIKVTNREARKPFTCEASRVLTISEPLTGKVEGDFTISVDHGTMTVEVNADTSYCNHQWQDSEWALIWVPWRIRTCVPETPESLILVQSCSRCGLIRVKPEPD